MNFHDHIPLYEHMRRANPGAVPEKIEPFYRNQMMALRREYELTGNRHIITAYNQSYAEMFWNKNGKPYFKVFPDLLPMFMRTKLSVPGKYLHSPFPNFLIRLSENHGCEELTVNGVELKSALITETSREDTWELADPVDHSHMFIVWMNFGETHRGMPYYIYQVMKFRAEETIDEAIARQRTTEKVDTETLSMGLDISNEEINSCMRLVVSTCFLATGADRIVEPDVLTNDLHRYIDAHRMQNTERVEQLHKRAQKRGKKGWTLGREILIPARSQSDGDSEPTGKHLSHQHQRGAHFHVYHYGPGKTKWKVKWINQLTVRADLPLPAGGTKRGYVAK